MRRLLLALLAAALLGACARPAAPAPTPPAATAAARPATPTPAAPDIAAQVGAALARTAALDRYRMRVRASSWGGPDAGLVTPFRPDGGPQDYLFTRAGARSAVAHYAPYVSASDPVHHPLPQLVADADAESFYASGPVALPGMFEPIWYELGPAPPPFLALPPDLRASLEILADGLPLADLSPAGERALGGAACAVYAGGPRVTALLLRGAAPAAGELAFDAAAAERLRVRPARSSSELWLCADGLVRRLRASLEGDSWAGPTRRDPFVIELDLAIVDHGPAVSVELPSGAVPRPLTREVGTAVVAHGGNVRATPAEGAPQDQAHAGEMVSVFARSGDGGWYLIVTPRRLSGWISATLLDVPPVVATEAPIADGFSTAPLGLPWAVAPPLPQVAGEEPPRSGPPMMPGEQLFTAGPLEVIARASYAGGDMAGGGAEVYARMRALGGVFREGADSGEQAGLPLALLLYDSELGPSGVVTNVTAIRADLPEGMTLPQYIQQSVAQLPPAVTLTNAVLVLPGRYLLEARVDAGERPVAEVIAILPYARVSPEGRLATELWIVTFATGAAEFDARRTEFYLAAERVHLRPH